MHRFATFVLAAIIALPVHAAVTKKEDRFTGATTFSYQSKFNVRHHEFVLLPASFHASATYEPGKPDRYSIMILTSSSIGRRGNGGWRYLGITNIDWLVDGKPIELSQATTQRSVKSGFVMEIFFQDLTKEQVAILGAASAVEFRIGQDEFKLSQADIAALAELAATVRPTKAGT